MKAHLILLLLLLSGMTKAQTWNEIINQKETQKKYILQQLAALKLYAGLLKDGYTAVNKGLNSIKEFTKGELNLHTVFINSLKVVNPIVSKNWKVAEIISLQSAIRKNFKESSKLEMSQGEGSYLESVRLKVFEECSNDMEELLLVISSGKLEMKDDERISRIDNLYESMKDKYQFTESFLSQVKLLNLQKEREEKNANTSKRNYQLNN
ncbi:hypothetical protein WG906_03180 [Pedobacter sp. P351]|uniref:hypothetical protein n=1 Tax=Pedobacter superstes TaxID=3133441 RepID=UPI00309FACFD